MVFVKVKIFINKQFHEINTVHTHFFPSHNWQYVIWRNSERDFPLQISLEYKTISYYVCNFGNNSWKVLNVQVEYLQLNTFKHIHISVYVSGNGTKNRRASICHSRWCYTHDRFLSLKIYLFHHEILVLMVHHLTSYLQIKASTKLAFSWFVCKSTPVSTFQC